MSPNVCLCPPSVVFSIVFLSPSCHSVDVVHISQAAALKGDGYRGRPSPHSPSEMFQGVTVLKAVKVCSSAASSIKHEVFSFTHMALTSYLLLNHVSFPLQLGQEGKVPLKSARLFFDLSDKVKKAVESHFSLETPLYFSYSHLVCRAAIDGKSD